MILITGGTGFVGRHLVWELVRQGYPVRVLARNLSRTRDGLPQEVEVVKGDITDRTSLLKACEGVNTVIHLVAIIRENENITFDKINVEGVLNMVIAAEEKGVERFIHMSALGASNNPSYRYVYSKWLGEKSVSESNLRWSVLRPSVIYGEGFCFFDRLLQSVKMFPFPFVPVPGKGETLFQPIAVEDVVKCIMTLLKNPAMTGKVYEIGGPEYLTYRQMLSEVLKVRGIKRIKINIPSSLMNMTVPTMTKILKDPPVTLVELKQLEINNITELDVVKKNFGFYPIPFSEGIRYMAKKHKDG